MCRIGVGAQAVAPGRGVDHHRRLGVVEAGGDLGGVERQVARGCRSPPSDGPVEPEVSSYLGGVVRAGAVGRRRRRPAGSAKAMSPGRGVARGDHRQAGQARRRQGLGEQRRVLGEDAGRLQHPQAWARRAGLAPASRIAARPARWACPGSWPRRRSARGRCRCGTGSAAARRATTPRPRRPPANAAPARAPRRRSRCASPRRERSASHTRLGRRVAQWSSGRGRGLEAGRIGRRIGQHDLAAGAMLDLQAPRRIARVAEAGLSGCAFAVHLGSLIPSRGGDGKAQCASAARRRSRNRRSAGAGPSASAARSASAASASRPALAQRPARAAW